MHMFICKEKDTELILQNINEDVTWSELTETYFSFLQASGYSLTRQDFAEEIQERFRSI